MPMLIPYVGQTGRRYYSTKFGDAMSLRAWASMLDIDHDKLNYRLNNGMDIDEALNALAGTERPPSPAKPRKPAALREQSGSHLITHNGTTKYLAAWARDAGLTPATLASRLRMGWTIERALSQPLRSRRALLLNSHCDTSATHRLPGGVEGLSGGIGDRRTVLRSISDQIGVFAA